MPVLFLFVSVVFGLNSSSWVDLDVVGGVSVRVKRGSGAPELIELLSEGSSFLCGPSSSSEQLCVDAHDDQNATLTKCVSVPSKSCSVAETSKLSLGQLLRMFQAQVAQLSKEKLRLLADSWQGVKPVYVENVMLTHDWSLCDLYLINSTSLSWPTVFSFQSANLQAPEQMLTHLHHLKGGFATFGLRSSSDPPQIRLRPVAVNLDRIDAKSSTKDTFVLGTCLLENANIYFELTKSDARLIAIQQNRDIQSVCPKEWQCENSFFAFDTAAKTCVDLCTAYWFRFWVEVEIWRIFFDAVCLGVSVPNLVIVRFRSSSPP